MSDTDKLVKDMAQVLLLVAEANEPEMFKAFFCGGIIANTIGHLSDEYWREFMVTRICNEPGCDCYKVQEAVSKALDLLREDFKKTTKPKNN